ncbi:hypothetical protein AGMMS50284_7050 [Clostridia bacterium]|nr:hypothetical protein AGMMS50284_7050 [Clostridia bacterium]
MKKILLILLACVMFVLSGCDNNTANNSSAPITDVAAPVSNGKVVEIKEKLFIGQINNIWLNKLDYIGKTIKYEGMFTQYYSDISGLTYYMVYRKSPGCCGADGQAGFEVIWPDGSDKTYPKENDWCEAVGKLESYEDDGQTYLRLRLDSLTVKSERGEELVSQ